MKKEILYIICFGIFWIFGITGYRISDNKPTISVVMSTYNRAHILPQAIESILNQSYTDFEFIIIDDGSQDNTAEVIKQYAKKDNRIRFLENKQNRGLIFSLNRGLDEARGKYIARMDDDDFSFPWRFKRQVQAMEMHPEITLLAGKITNGQTNITNEPTKPITIESPNEVQIKLILAPLIAHPTIMIRTDFLKQHNLKYQDKNLYCEDYGLYKDILKFGGTLSRIEDFVLKYKANEIEDHASNYYKTQYGCFKQVQSEMFEHVTGIIPENYFLGHARSHEKRCILLKWLEKKNTGSRLDNEELVRQQQYECSLADITETALVKHPYWTDLIIFQSDDNAFLFGANSKAQVIKKDTESFTLKWELYGTESFVKNDDGSYTLHQ